MLMDAAQVIKVDPSSPFGYKRRGQALRGVQNHSDAADASDTVPLTMSEPPNPEIHELVLADTPERFRTLTDLLKAVDSR